jgi:hypothetical protein
MRRPISKPVMIELLEGYNEDQIKAIAERAQKKVTEEITLLLLSLLALL